MNFNHRPHEKKARQTNIIDNAAAIALAEAQSHAGRRGAKKGGPKGKGFNFSAKNAGATKATPKPRGTGAGKLNPEPKNDSSAKTQPKMTGKYTSEATFYEENAPRVPLLDRNDKTKENARSGVATAKKLEVERFPSKVQNGVRNTKVQDFEATSKQKHGLRVQDVEPKAFGNGPKEATPVADPRRNPRIEGGQQKHIAKPTRNFANIASDQDTSLTGKLQKNKRKNAEYDLELIDHRATKRTKLAYSQASNNSDTLSVSDHAAAQERSNQHLKPPTQTQLPTQSATQDMSPLRKRPGQGQRATPLYLIPKDQHTSNSAHDPHGTPKPPNQGSDATKPSKKYKAPQTSPDAHPLRHKETHPSVTDATADPLTHKKSKKKKNFDLFVPKTFNMEPEQQHPLIDALNLDPRWDPTNPYTQHTIPATRVLNLPSQRCHAIFTAESDSVVHITEIPYALTRMNKGLGAQDGQPLPRDQEKSSQPATPYLKPGLHGYDYGTHRWYFDSDPDLRTGVGHQVEPEDEVTWESIVFRWGVQARLVQTQLCRELAELEYEFKRLSYDRPASPEVETARGQLAEKEKQVETETKKLTELTQEKDLFMMNYSKKYPGKACGLWPCGCPRVGCGAWEEGDSEEE